MFHTSRPRLLNDWSWRALLVLWAGLLGLLTVARVVFAVMYWGALTDATWRDLVLAFLNGARFDLSVIFAFTGIPALAVLLLSPLPGRRVLHWLLFAWVAVLGLAFAVLSAIDVNYYAYVARRVSFEVVEMRHDWRPIAALIASGYTVQVVAVLAAAVGLLWLWGRWYARTLARPWQPVHWWSHLVQVAVLFPLIVLIIRGGIQKKPLSVGMAFLGPHIAVGHLTLNPEFTAVSAWWRGKEGRLTFMKDTAAVERTRTLLGLPATPADPHYPLLHRQRSLPLKQPRNLVIITIESFSAQFTNALGGTHNVTPEFDKLVQEGLLFSNFHASGTRSLEGIASILTGFPALPTHTLIGSTAEQTSVRSLPLILKDHGYSAFFLHGAFRGSMWFDTFAQRHGFDKYIAKEDFPDADKISDSMWGVYDEYTLQRFHQELEKAKKPVLGFYFSLNPHTPYELPDPRFKVFGPGQPQADLLNAVHYTDYALGRFFDKARKSDYWNHTVFVITADHNLGKWKLNARDRMWIPLLILVPGDPHFPRGVQSDTLGSQVDIAPTLMELLGITDVHAFAGRSLLDPVRRRFALFGWGNRVGWLTNDLLLIHDLERPLYLYDRHKDPTLTHDLFSRGVDPASVPAVQDLEAYLQALNNLLVDNRLAPLDSAHIALMAPAPEATDPPKAQPVAMPAASR